METSKVLVEYSDPSYVYPLIEEKLTELLPLRNLHWNSSSRPLRSISSLYIDFTPAADNPSLKVDSSAFNDDGSTFQSESSRKERRHQMPGLRQTPYLKIYLLDCADIDTYRASARKQLREWIKEHTNASHGTNPVNKQENHDAFEWLIVHVVRPSANDSEVKRSLSAAKNDGDTTRRLSSTKWPSRNAVTMIEKIRADFNGSSKSSVDRVVQVEMVEQNSNGTKGNNLQAEDRKKAWDDLIYKMKALILVSFDLRVSQYESVIREKEQQRNLPGWNFNTFFVLKEGLARGFESVGLIEDALADYHGLAAGLDAVIDEQSNKHTGPQTTRFNHFTTELQQAYQQAQKASEGLLNPADQKALAGADIGVSILDTDKQAFRESILANNVSVFEFKNYVFARQFNLLLRLANAVIKPSVIKQDTDDNSHKTLGAATSTRPSNPNDHESENLHILAEACQLASHFISSAARRFKDDIIASVHIGSLENNGEGLSRATVDHRIVEDLVSSWVFSACQRILEATSASSLSTKVDPLFRHLQQSPRSGTNDNGLNAAEVAKSVHHRNLPERSSSLSAGASSIAQPHVHDPSSIITSLDGMKILPPITNHAGFQELAAERGGLYALSKRALCGAGIRHRLWQRGLTDLSTDLSKQVVSMDNVDLDKGSQQALQDFRSPHVSNAAIRDRFLFDSMQSQNAFFASYEELTMSALAHYLIGERSKMAEGMTADLGVICFYLKDYGVAASYFGQLASFYESKDWIDLGVEMLDMWAQCLKHLDRPKEYIPIALKTLAYQSHVLYMCGRANWSLPDLISASICLEQSIKIPMDTFLGKPRLDPHINHDENHDGFTMLLHLESKISSSFRVQEIRVKIISAEGEDRSGLWLSVQTAKIITAGSNQILVESKTMIPGWYILDMVLVHAEKIAFIYEPGTTQDAPLLPRENRLSVIEDTPPEHRKRILIWARAQNFVAHLSHSETINLSEVRALRLSISSGWNDIFQGKVVLKAASAGLRIHGAEADAYDAGIAIVDQSITGVISFGHLASRCTTSIRVPYSLEHDHKDIAVGLEISYTTKHGEFTYAFTQKVSTLLPVAVNVQDKFEKNALFSIFTIGSATALPLRVYRCHVEDNLQFSAVSPPLESHGIDVFAHQPLSLVSKICRRKGAGQDGAYVSRQEQRRLRLKLEYRCLDIDVVAAVEDDFLRTFAASPLAVFSHILSQTLTTHLRSTVSNSELDTMGLVREVNIGTYDEYGWDDIVNGISSESSAAITQLLKHWHQSHRTMSLDSQSTSSTLQHLNIPVDLPDMKIVHTVSLHPSDESTGLSTDHSFIAVGQVLNMRITIKHTRRWGFQKSSSVVDTAAIDFGFEVQANPDTWLIGGQRKANFSAKENEVKSFALLLLPQRTGNLPYPSFDIQPIIPRQAGVDSVGREEAGAIISYEVDYREHARTMFVIPGMSSTTASLDPRGSVGGAWLVEAKGRWEC